MTGSRLNRYKEGKAEESLKELGKGLHALQDVDAHGDASVDYFGQLRGGRWSHQPGLLGGPANIKLL